jgi:hypothetical protein
MPPASFLYPRLTTFCRTIANSSMWTQGLGALESEIRTIKGKDVLVVVLNESSAEFDWEASAFDLERGKTAVVDVTVRLEPSQYFQTVNFAALALSPLHFVFSHPPCSFQSIAPHTLAPWPSQHLSAPSHPHFAWTRHAILTLVPPVRCRAVSAHHAPPASQESAPTGANGLCPPHRLPFSRPSPHALCSGAPLIFTTLIPVIARNQPVAAISSP